MKSAWRELLSKASIGSVGIVSVVVIGGCQSFSPSSWGVPTSTRVPPPPTGSVHPQGAYYNNPATGTSAAPISAPVKSMTQVMPNAPAPVVTASAVNTFGSNGSMPATNMSPSSTSGAFSTGATSIGYQGTGGQVSTAGYTDNGSGMAEVVTAGSVQGTANGDSNGNKEVYPNAGTGASLQWTAK